jgi:uncharacterized protein (DUF2147 family)
MRLAATAIIGAFLVAGPAMASDINGVWQRDNGLSRIRMAPCGGGVCGVVSWLKDPANSQSKVGQRVFYDMKQDGGGWTGKAFNPDDGKTYTGKASVSGSTMTTQGCMLGGLVCKSVTWTRVN